MDTQEELINPKTRIILYIDCFRLEFETAIDAVDFIRAYTDNFQKEPQIYDNQML